MNNHYKGKNNPRVIIIQKLYGKYFNKDEVLTFSKHRFKKFIKDVVNGTIERDDVIKEEIKNHLSTDLKLQNLDKVFQVIIKSAIFEFLYKPKTSVNICGAAPPKFPNSLVKDAMSPFVIAPSEAPTAPMSFESIPNGPDSP